MSRHRLVIVPPLLILIPLSCFLNFYHYNLPQLSPLPPLPPPHPVLPSCWNVSSPTSPRDLSLWQMLHPLLATLEVCKVLIRFLISSWIFFIYHPHSNPFHSGGGQGALLSLRWVCPILGQVILFSIWSFLSYYIGF